MESITVLRRWHLVFANTTWNMKYNQNKHETKVSTHPTSSSVNILLFCITGWFFRISYSLHLRSSARECNTCKRKGLITSDFSQWLSQMGERCSCVHWEHCLIAWIYSLVLALISMPGTPSQVTVCIVRYSEVQSEHQPQLWKGQNLKWIRYNSVPLCQYIPLYGICHYNWKLRIVPLHSIHVINPFQNISPCSTLLAS